MDTHIFIATTQGPIAVQKITEEESDVRSVVCIDGSSRPASISERYYDFVKKGTGIIARNFGHDSYRVDISTNIETGYSWQLAVYLAHQLQKQGRLGNGNPTAGDIVVIATGEVDKDLNIRKVDSVPEKLVASLVLLEEWHVSDISTILVVPEQNSLLLAPAWVESIDLNSDWFHLLSLDRIPSIRLIEALCQEGSEADEESNTENKGTGKGGILLLIILLGVVGILMGVWSLNQTALNEVAIVPSDSSLSVSKQSIVEEVVASDMVVGAYQLVAVLFSAKEGCESNNLKTVTLTLGDTNHFQTLEQYRYMCELVLTHTMPTIANHHVETIDLNKAKVTPAPISNTKGWQLVNPTSDTNKYYAWLVFDKKPDLKMWNNFLRQLERYEVVDKEALKKEQFLEALLSKNSLHANVYRHNLSY